MSRWEPVCSPPGGGWCASAETTLRGDKRASPTLPPAQWPSGKTPTVQPRKSPVGRFVRLDIRLVISASTSGAGRGHANPCLIPAHSRPDHPANGFPLPDVRQICPKIDGQTPHNLRRAICRKVWLVPTQAFPGLWGASTAIAKQQLKLARDRNRCGVFFVTRRSNDRIALV